MAGRRAQGVIICLEPRTRYIVEAVAVRASGVGLNGRALADRLYDPLMQFDNRREHLAARPAPVITDSKPK